VILHGFWLPATAIVIEIHFISIKKRR